MTTSIKRKILRIIQSTTIDMLDIKAVQRYLLEQKMYEVVIFINNDLDEYRQFVLDNKRK